MNGPVMRNRGHAVGFVLSCWLAVAALPLADVANASSMDEAQAAYAEGRFTDAARIAESLGTSRGFALAAESLTVHGYFIAARGEKEGLFERAGRQN